VLLARLEITGLQRGAHDLSLFAPDPPGGGVGLWFANRALGISTGVSEGVATQASAECVLDRVEGIASASKDRFVQLATVIGDEDGGNHPVGSRRTYRLKRWIVTRFTSPMRELLPLADSFETMLAGLGRHTRRNIRGARRQAEDRGISFRFKAGGRLVSHSVLTMLAARTRPYGLPEHRIIRLEHFAERTGRPFRSVLAAADGSIVSYCCGFLGGSGEAYLLYQLNEPAWHTVGPSLMHRSFLIETLIAGGTPELVFVHGCSGTLRHFCVPMTIDRFFLMRRTASAYFSAAAIAALKPKTDLGIGARAVLSEGLTPAAA